MLNAKLHAQKGLLVPNSTQELVPPRASGYTLIEILMAMAILTLIFTIGFVSYRAFSRRQALVGVNRTLQGDIRLTQELALAGKKPAACGVNALDGYYFLVSPPGGYQIIAVCGGTLTTEKTVTLPTGFTLSALSPNLTPANSILFKTIGAGTNIPAGQNTTITLTQSVTLSTVVITVTAGGEVR